MYLRSLVLWRIINFEGWLAPLQKDKRRGSPAARRIYFCLIWVIGKPHYQEGSTRFEYVWEHKFYTAKATHHTYREDGVYMRAKALAKMPLCKIPGHPVHTGSSPPCTRAPGKSGNSAGVPVHTGLSRAHGVPCTRACPVHTGSAGLKMAGYPVHTGYLPRAHGANGHIPASSPLGYIYSSSSSL